MLTVLEEKFLRDEGQEGCEFVVAGRGGGHLDEVGPLPVEESGRVGLQVARVDRESQGVEGRDLTGSGKSYSGAIGRESAPESLFRRDVEIWTMLAKESVKDCACEVTLRFEVGRWRGVGEMFAEGKNE